MVGSDDSIKIREYGTATVLLAGNHARAMELATACKPSIREFADRTIEHNDLDLAVDQFMQQLRKAASAKKAFLIGNLVENSIGVKHSEFVKLPTDQYLDVWQDIRRMNLGADLIIATVKHEPVIIRLDRFGEPHWETNYSAIGNGADIARAMLCLQQWMPSDRHQERATLRFTVPIQECAFRLMEAHFAANKANPSSVGSRLILRVLGQGHRANICPENMDTLNGLLKLKHRVPELPPAEKNKFLFGFQACSTGVIEESEEPEIL
jgi:hypothetical protein